MQRMVFLFYHCRTRGRVRAGPSFQLGTLSTLSHKYSHFSAAYFDITGAPYHFSKLSWRQSIVLVKRSCWWWRATRYALLFCCCQTSINARQTRSQSDSTQLKAGNLPVSCLAAAAEETMSACKKCRKYAISTLIFWKFYWGHSPRPPYWGGATAPLPRPYIPSAL